MAARTKSNEPETETSTESRKPLNEVFAELDELIEKMENEESLEKATQDLAFSSPPSLEPPHPL